MDRDLLIGTRKLVSAEYRSDDDEVHYLLGGHPIGQIMYDERGYMSAQLMDADRPRPLPRMTGSGHARRGGGRL